MEKKNIIMWAADAAGCFHARINIQEKYLNKKYCDFFEVKSSSIMNPKDWVEFNSEGKITKVIPGLTIHQRQYGAPNLQNFRFLRTQLRVPCIYEIDDYLHGVPLTSSARFAYDPQIQKERFQNIDLYLKEADAITVSTEYLKKLYYQYNKNIYVLQNCIDFELYEDSFLTLREISRQEHKQKGEIWLGWAGSNTHLPDLNVAKDAVIQILREFPQVKLALGGWDGTFKDKDGNLVAQQLNPWKDIPAERKIAIPWATEMKHYPKMLTNFDIGIAPLENNDFNRAKSNIKFLEYAACGVPVIASDVEPYGTTITNGETGLLVQSNGSIHFDWYKKIKCLILDEQLRLRLAENANKFIKANYDIAKNIDQWKNCYDEIIRRGVK
jgi:glycosyltransferase involved in cell wall biosynthesis